LFSKKKREDKKRNKKMKSKLTDEDIPDLADLMGEKHFPDDYSDNLSLQGNATCIATLTEWPSIEYGKTKTIIVTLINRKGRGQFIEKQ